MTKTGTRRVTIVALFSIRRFRKRSAAVAAAVAATALLAMSCRHYRNEFAVNALKITVGVAARVLCRRRRCPAARDDREHRRRIAGAAIRARLRHELVRGGSSAAGPARLG